MCLDVNVLVLLDKQGSVELNVYMGCMEYGISDGRLKV